MERKQFEKYLKDILEEVLAEYMRYCPEDGEVYLSMYIYGDAMAANNTHWEEDIKHKVDMYAWISEDAD